VRHLLEPICREGRLHGLGSFKENRMWAEGAGLVVQSIDDLSRSVRGTWSRVAGRVLRGIGSNATYRKYLLDRSRSERIFAITVGRLWLAYRTGALRYALIVARKP
jgi:tocopherol O-methyltransferase